MYHGPQSIVRDGYALMVWLNGTDIHIRDCTFAETWNKPLSIQTYDPTGNSHYSGIYIYRNVFKNAGGAFEACLQTADTGNTMDHVYLVNNVIYNIAEGLMQAELLRCGQGSTPSAMWWTHYKTFTNCVMKNNIFYGDSYYFHRLKAWNAPTYWDLSGWDIDYNCYYPASSAAFIDNGTFQTLAQWRGNSWAPDAHSIASDPLFMDAASGDFRLRASSPCLGAGVAIPGISSGQTPNMGM